MKNLYLFLCIICLMLFGMANSSANTFDFGSLKLNVRRHVLLSKVAVPTPKITASSTTICKGSKVTLTASACINGVLKWTDGLEGNSIIVSPAATKSYRVLCKLNSAPTGSPTMSDSSTAVKITVNPIPATPKITSNTYCNNPVSVLGDISFGGDNTDYLSGTCISKDGALVMIGYSASGNNGDKSQTSKGGSDYWVVKVNASGTKVWDKTFGGTGDDVPLSIIPTSDGGFLINGYSNSPKSGDKSEASKGGYDYWLVKIDANGTKVWDKSFGGSGSDYAISIIATSDNNFLITGHSDSEIGGNKSVSTKGSLDYWIVKIKPDGTKIWDKAYGGSGVEYLASITTTKEGGFLLAGHSSSLAGGDKSESTKGNSDYWLVKIDANGAKVWDKSYGASSQEELSNIAPTFDGGFILGGISNSKAGGDKIGASLGGFDYWIVKVNADGTKLWDKVFGGSDTEYFAKILPTADGGCLLGGTSYSKISGNESETSVNGDFWIVKLTADGSKAWDKVVGGNSADVLKDMFLGENGNVVLSGYSFSDAGSSKRQASKGSSDYWTVYTQVCDNSYKPYTNLVATGCTGVVTWSNNATGSTITVSPSVATNFTATCSINGCVSVASNSITVNPPKPATPSIAASSTSICEGSPVVLSSSNSLNGTITWSGGTKGSSITIYPTTTKTYKSVSNVNGINSDSSNSITITVLPKPTQPKITVSNSSICIGSSTTLTASACTGGITTWTGGLTGSSITVTPSKTTVYKASCTVNTCRSDSSTATTITVIAKPTQPKITASNSTICQGGSTTLTASACTGGILTWTGGLTGNSITVSPIATKSYKVLCTQGTCKSDSSVASTITVTTKPQAPVISSKTNYTSNNVRVIWDKTFGGSDYDNFSSIISTSDGGMLIGGSSSSNISGDKTQISKGLSDYWIIKIDANGNKIWDKTFGGISYDVLSSIVLSNDGGILLGGSSKSSISGDKTQDSNGEYDYWVVKIDFNGNKIWDKTFGGSSYDESPSIMPTIDGGFLICGSSSSNASGDKTQDNKGGSDYWVVKVDSNGKKIWDRSFGGSNDDIFSSIIATSDEGFILGGYSYSGISGDKTQANKGNYDYWIIKIDVNGKKVWDKSFGGGSADQLSTIVSISGKSFILGGFSYSGISWDKTQANKGIIDYWIIKIDPNGNKIWDKSFGGSNTDQLSDIILTNDGGYILGGYSNSGLSEDKTQTNKGQSDYWIIKVDSNGEKVWDKSFGGNSYDNLVRIVSSNDEDLLLGGYSYSGISGDKTNVNKGSSSSDYWLIKIKENQIESTTTLTATGCTGVVTWSNNATGNTLTVSPSVATNYTATCKVNGCTSISSNVVTVNSSKPDTPSIAASNSSICAGNSVVLNSSSSPNGTITWTGGLKGNSITISPTTTKTYKSVCSVNGINSDSSASITIIVIPKPTQPKITASNSTICLGSSTTLTSTACTGGSSTWTGGLIGNSITVSPTATKSYKVLCTQGTCKSDSSLATTITVVPKPTQPKITASNSTICLGSSVTLTSTACTGGVLTWTGGAIGNSITVSPTATKSYKVLCTQGTCKSDSSVATTITVTSKPTQPKITASNSTICSGSSVTLTSTACTGGTLTWTGGATGSSITVSPTATKSYKVLCTQGTCKSDSSLATTITVISKPTQPKITASNSTICLGGSTVLTSTACTGGVLTWTGGATGSSITVSPTATKSYKVLCTQGTCKSDSSVTTTITVITKPTQPKITASNSTICAGSSVTLTSTACTGGVSTWTGGATGSSITVSPSVTKSYKVLCTQGTCKSDSSVATTITVIAKPTQPKITASNSAICAGSSITLTSTACTGGTSTWTGGLTGSSITVSPTATKSYKVLCTQGTCKSDSSVATTITVTTKPQTPVITKSSNNSIVKQWDKTIGGDSVDGLKSMVSTKNGGVMLGGYTFSAISGDKTKANKGDSDYWVVEIDANGNKLWDKTFGGNNMDGLQNIIASNDGGYILGGDSKSGISGDKTQVNNGGLDYWVVKIDANGNKLWDKSFGGNKDEALRSIVSTKDGGFILGGYTFSSISGDKTQINKGDTDYWLVKIDANGNKLWDKSFGGNNYDNFMSIVESKDGGFLLGGYSFSNISGDKTQANKGDSDYWVVKIDINGNKLWDKTYGGMDKEYLSEIVSTMDGGFMLGGYTFSNISGDVTQANKGGIDYWVVKIDANGNKLWDKSFGGNSSDYLWSIKSNNIGEVILGGYSWSDKSGDKSQDCKGNYDYWVVKVDANGDKLWDKSFGGDNGDILQSIVVTNDNSFLIGGESYSGISGDKTQSNRGRGDYWILKIKENKNTTTTLTATGCTGTVTWSNGSTGNSITVSPTVATTYTATCTVNTCKSAVSNAITVSPDVIPNGKIEADVAIESEPSFNFKVFPNPAKDELTIQTDLEGEATFHLYNSIGQKVLEKTFEKQTKIDLKNLSKGSHIYLIQHDKTQTSGKVLLE